MNGAAADGRDDNVQSGNVYLADALAEQQQIKPTALNRHAAHRAQRGKIRRGFTTKCDVGGHESGTGKIKPVVMADLDLAGEDILQHGLHDPISIRPMHVEQVNAD